MLRPVDQHDPMHLRALYSMLGERTPEQAISHKTMPTFDEHCQFVRSKPYLAWYLIIQGVPIGTIYITPAREVGIHVRSSMRGKGHGDAALRQLRSLHPGPLYANIAPKNAQSIAFFTSRGAQLIQHVYLMP